MIDRSSGSAIALNPFTAIAHPKILKNLLHRIPQNIKKSTAIARPTEIAAAIALK